MARITKEASTARQKVLGTMASLIQTAVETLGTDSLLVKRSDIEAFLLKQEEFDPGWLKWFSVALRLAADKGLIVKAGSARGKGAGWKATTDTAIIAEDVPESTTTTV